MASNNLFPPIIDDYLPAFLQADNSCNIVFKLAQFNKESEFDLSLTQITISNLNTNKSMLNLNKYPNEIKIAAATLNSDGTYSVVLNAADLKTNKFEINTYYKIQVRLTGINAEAYDKTKEAKVYYCSTYNKNYINGWRVATEQKTREYINSLFPSNGQIDYINKYL